MMEVQRTKQFLEHAFRANGTLRHFVEDAPPLQHVHGGRGYLDFFLNVVEALESGVSKADEDIESNMREFLDGTLTRFFSNLCRHDPTFDLSCMMDAVPVELRGPFRDEVHGHV